jgi:hypothetical protein
MPISRDQFESLGDYSDLEQLHVYGDLLRLYSLEVHTTIDEAASLFRDIRSLDGIILTVYVSYVMGRLGFYSQLLASEDFPERQYTTEFKDSDWLENLVLFEHEEVYQDEWEMYFENERNEKIKVIFVTLLLSDKDPISGEYDEAAHLVNLFDESCSNCVVVHPRLSRKAKQTFMKTKNRMKQKTGEDIVLSTGQFVSKFIPDETKRKTVEANWEVLREKILGMLQKEWQILVYSIHDEQLSDIRTRLRKARQKYELGVEFEDSVKDAGISCEGLLQILHSIYPKKIDKRMDFNELLCDLKEIIIEEFGEDIYQDLNLIRVWRNNVLHPPVTKPDANIALKILSKAELFHELFHKKIKSVHVPQARSRK